MGSFQCFVVSQLSALHKKVRLDKSCGWLDCSDGDTFGVDVLIKKAGSGQGCFVCCAIGALPGNQVPGGGRLCMLFTTGVVLVQGGNTFTHWLWLSMSDGLWRIRTWRKAHGVKPRQYFGPLLGISDASFWRDFASVAGGDALPCALICCRSV